MITNPGWEEKIKNSFYRKSYHKSKLMKQIEFLFKVYVLVQIQVSLSMQTKFHSRTFAKLGTEINYYANHGFRLVT